ncbi:MAG TPA: glycosyltransferase, partial [Adhaeribacter sp.]|nr:glycosyltransferase [Adhaeribacter sp.]
MVSELSILIPFYNQDVRQLTEQLVKQCQSFTSRFEICIYDDCSDNKFRKAHRHLFHIPQVRYVELRKNIGRAAIRNLLAKEANYKYLLFLDNDSALPDDQFIKRYWRNESDCDVLIGGTIYETEAPSEILMLRWRYGRAREERPAAVRNQNPYQSLTLNNMLIKRAVYLAHPLCTELTGYGHEDTKFGWELQRSGAKVCHIDNPVIHIGLEPASDFLKKTEQAVRNLYHLYRTIGAIPDSKLVASYERLKKAKMCRPYQMVFKVFEPTVLDNLRSPDPNLTYFDLYKLYLFITEAGKKS